jgi:hypothetical protein
MRVSTVSQAGAKPRDGDGLSVRCGPFTLTREPGVGRWFINGTSLSYTIKELQQLAEVIELVSASLEAPTVDDVEVVGGVGVDAIDVAREMFQEQAENVDGPGVSVLGGDIDVEFGVGPCGEVHIEERPRAGAAAVAAMTHIRRVDAEALQSIRGGYPDFHDAPDVADNWRLRSSFGGAWIEYDDKSRVRVTPLGMLVVDRLDNNELVLVAEQSEQ